MTAGQRQRDHGAGVAHHRAAHQLAQPFRVGRLARLAGDHVSGAKFLQRLEDARLEQSQHVVQLGQVVLHRGGRQQQQEAFIQPVHQRVALAVAVAQVMGLVNHDKIEAAAQ